ncbi:TPA: shufflon system plasmid conjugative transfer pilus tip adhesin PilV, partial [Escherichia coli]|nr:shufflon system plasmid conjugative transfer pilus tip adhesin PilV [Escherichia coli]
TRNNKGWMNITHGGGFTMTDSQWIRAVNGKGITTTGEIKGGKVSGGTVRSDGRLSTGEYLQLDKTATAGTKCAPDGLVGRTSTGAILSCQSGVWKNNISDALVFDYSACYDAEEDSRKPVYANWGSGSNGFAVCDGKAGYGAAGFRAYRGKPGYSGSMVWVKIRCCKLKLNTP